MSEKSEIEGDNHPLHEQVEASAEAFYCSNFILEKF